MTEPVFYSIRMHAAAGPVHISGAERITTACRVDDTVKELVNRAMGKKRSPDRIVVTIEDLGPANPRLLHALDIVLMPTGGPEDGRSAAYQALMRAGVSDKAAAEAIDLLSLGAASPGVNMRGAMIMNARTGERLEPDLARGVRASRFDWTMQAELRIRKKLEERRLSHFRTREALALATKVAHGPGVVAELCWSDDPDYTAGYAASLSFGYLRFPFLKKYGNNKGGRAIFIRPETDVPRLIEYLQLEAVFIDC